MAIIGDQSDNIPGLPGVGPKTASKWLKEYGTLNNIILNAGRIQPKRFCSLVYEKREELQRNRELVRLESDISLDMLTSIMPDIDLLTEIFSELEMKQSLAEVKNRYLDD